MTDFNSLGCPVSTLHSSNISDLLQMEHPQNLAGIRAGCGRIGFSVYTEPSMSLKRKKLLLTSCRILAFDCSQNV